MLFAVEIVAIHLSVDCSLLEVDFDSPGAELPNAVGHQDVAEESDRWGGLAVYDYVCGSPQLIVRNHALIFRIGIVAWA